MVCLPTLGEKPRRAEAVRGSADREGQVPPGDFEPTEGGGLRED